MKKAILLTLSAAAAVGAYFAVKNCSCTNERDDQLFRMKRERHLTNAFSKAKQQAISEDE